MGKTGKMMKWERTGKGEVISLSAPPRRKGHKSHKSGAGKHDSRPNRERTRSTENDRAIREAS